MQPYNGYILHHYSNLVIKSPNSNLIVCGHGVRGLGPADDQGVPEMRNTSLKSHVSSFQANIAQEFVDVYRITLQDMAIISYRMYHCVKCTITNAYSCVTRSFSFVPLLHVS